MRYIAGFPPHPHRGFETVTYMIDGHMRHEDHLGNVGELKSGRTAPEEFKGGGRDFFGGIVEDVYPV